MLPAGNMMMGLGSVARRGAGFAMMEVLAAAGVAALVVASLFAYTAKQQRSAALDTYVLQQAREMSQLAEAVESYARGNGGDWPVGEPVQIDLAALRGGLLPEAFADRVGNQPVSPFHQPYAAAAVPNDGGEFAIVVYETGAAAASRLAQAGVKGSNRLSDLKAAVARELSVGYQRHAAVVAAGSSIAREYSGAFSIDLSTHLGTTPGEQPRVAVLVGFDELTIRDPVTAVQNRSKWGLCNFESPKRAGGVWRAPQCAAGREVLQKVPFCHSNATVYATDVGPITIDLIDDIPEYTTVVYGHHRWTPTGYAPYFQSRGWSDGVESHSVHRRRQWVELSGTLAHEVTCRTSRIDQGWTFTVPVPAPFPPAPSPNLCWPGNPDPETGQLGWPWESQHSGCPRPRVVNYGEQAWDALEEASEVILCCEPAGG